jgi:hypothetical protein
VLEIKNSANADIPVQTIATIGRRRKFRVAADGTLTKTEMGEAERRTALIQEFGLSDEIAQAVPHDIAGGVAPPGI